MADWDEAHPYVLTGTGGIEAVPFGAESWAAFTAPFAGSMTASMNADVTYEIYDVDGDLLQDDDDGELGVVLATGSQVKIKIIGQPDTAGTLTWTYAARASSALQVVLGRTEVLDTPGPMQLSLSNGTPNDTVTFSVTGPTAASDFDTVKLDEFGSGTEATVVLPPLQQGDYVLHAETSGGAGTDVDFTVLEDSLDFDIHVVIDPDPPDLDPVVRWTFYDPRNPGDTWTLQRNPASWSNMLPPNTFTEDVTVAPDGQPLTWEAGSRPWRMEFTGWIDDEDEYNRFVFWSQLRRRLWLIDHRNRAWLLTIEDLDAQAQIKPNLPWAHNYTVKTVIFKQGTD